MYADFTSYKNKKKVTQDAFTLRFTEAETHSNNRICRTIQLNPEEDYLNDISDAPESCKCVLSDQNQKGKM